MASRLYLRLHIDGARETLKAFNRLGKEANAALRLRALEIAQDLARDIQAAARAEGRQAAALADTVKVRKDRVPFVYAGGARKVTHSRKGGKAYQILFASEFGANQRSGWYAKARYKSASGRQYRRHNGTEGYWFFPTARRKDSEIARAWIKAADDIAREFGKDT